MVAELVAVAPLVEVAEEDAEAPPAVKIAPVRTWKVPFPELQQARASSSCPQQKEPYGPQGVMTPSPELKGSER